MARGLSLGVLVAVILSVGSQAVWAYLSPTEPDYTLGVAVTVIAIVAGVAYGRYTSKRGYGRRALWEKSDEDMT